MLLKASLDNICDPSRKIQKIKIKDSTRFILPENLKDDYPGTKGNACQAMASIQLEIDLLNTEINDLKLFHGTHNDQQESLDDIGHFEPDVLYIRDLGYANLTYMRNIQQVGGYYVNRLLPKTNIYRKKANGFEKLDLKTLSFKLNSHQIILDEIVYLGQEKYPSRLIIEPVPQAVQEKRVRQLSKYNARKKHQMSEDYRVRAGLNIWVTNLEKAYSGDYVSQLYRLRWQVELIFKCWKSLLKIDKIKVCKKERILCHLYSKLIVAVLHWQIFKSLKVTKAISFIKIQKIITGTINELRKFIFNTSNEWLKLLVLIKENAYSKEYKSTKYTPEGIIKKLTLNYEKYN
jgi:hypothetical protein